MSRYGYLEVFSESLGIRDNESRLYVIIVDGQIDVFGVLEFARPINEISVISG